MTDPHEDLVEAATRAWMDAPSNTDPMRAVIALIAERTKDATPEMEATLAERERCAKIAEAAGINDPHIAIVWQTAQQIADAIRSGPKP